MNQKSWPLSILIIASAFAAGCGDASSARETIPRTISEPSPNESATGTLASQEAERAGTSPRVDTEKPLSPGGIVETTFDDIKFPMEKTDDFSESMLTDRVQDLFGKRIRIRGYMFPTLRRKGLKEFVLVRDNMECCFGPGAALFDCILVSMVGSATAEFSIRPIAVEGEFQLNILRGPDGRPLAIYQMAGEAVN